ncbi:TetR family transcriptional regulator [Lysobacter maris]|uniref:TetR family transcriptional regulator n=1 Tax=Marilutibacter maris TaxID=1605891 RepID=A0A507ZRF1_9GAMM|nr:TetR/AcrR family transcriptional regulator [Lysobacter maris]KAB8162368.1 TetR family transcriptional regulator [Lysobacter maris]
MSRRHRARERLQKLSPAQRGAWLDIAEAEFRAHGFAAASLNRILASAGLSKGQAYYYFADKGELYRAVIERALGELAGLLDTGLPEPDSAEAYWREMEALFGRLTRVLKHNPRLAELGRGIHRETAAQVAVADLLATLRDRLGRTIEIGQQVGAVRSDLPLALLTDVAFAVAREIDRWFALDAQDLDEAAVLDLNRRAVGLVIAMLASVDAVSDTAHESFPSWQGVIR